MRLSTKGRYAVTAMLDLAIHEGIGPVTLSDISSCQGISLSYLEQLFARLRKHRLVRGVRGPGGGYRLARPAESISVAEVIAAVDEDVDGLQNQGPGRASHRCPTQDLWDVLSHRIYGFLDQMTLAELVADQALMDPAKRSEPGRGTAAA